MEDVCAEESHCVEGENSTDWPSERESLRALSAAIAARQRWEAAGERSARGALLDRVLALDLRLAELLRALSAAAAASAATNATAPDAAAVALAHALRFVFNF